MVQLALDLGLPTEPPATVVSRANEAAYRLLDDWPLWPDRVVIVRGPDGAGKSHLARAFAQRTGGTVVAAPDLEAGDVIALAACPVAVDDFERADERALFHLVNAVRAAGSTLLLIGRTRSAVRLPDLASRLRGVPELALAPPDDAMLRRVLVEAFLERQLPVDPAVVSFLMARMERTLHAARRVVEGIDRAALAERKGPTRPLAARVLRETGSRPVDSVP
jgi:chromosomal replication initiation ATPase DnaA